MKPSQGLTLIELVAASVLGLVIVLALGQVDVARVRLYEKNKAMGRQTTNPSAAESEVGWALSEIIKHTKQADRVVLRDVRQVIDQKTGKPKTDKAGKPIMVSNHVQLRIPKPDATTLAQLNDLGNYKWVQFKLNPDKTRHELFFYEDIATYELNPRTGLMELKLKDCTNADVVFRGVDDVRMQFLHVAKPALGGDPMPHGRDNNVLEIIVSSVEKMKFGATTVPAIAYTNLDSACSEKDDKTVCDSGSGLAPRSEIPPCS